MRTKSIQRLLIIPTARSANSTFYGPTFQCRRLNFGGPEARIFRCPILKSAEKFHNFGENSDVFMVFQKFPISPTKFAEC